MGNTFTTTQASAPTAALCSLDYVKTYMGISGTAYDAQLNALLTSASLGIERWCDRKFHQADYVEYHNGPDDWNTGFLRLQNFPIISIARVATRPVEALTIANTDTENVQRATAALDATNLTLVAVRSGVATTSTLAIASYPTINHLAAAVMALGGGWTATVGGTENDYGKWPSADLKVPQGALNARATGGARLDLYAEELGYMRPDSGDAHATLWGHFPNGYQNIEVRYTAGYATIPALVQQGCAMVVKAIYDAAKLDSNLAAERIGDYSYTRRASAGDFGDLLFADARLCLQPYRAIRF